jgi:hypothetical protein
MSDILDRILGQIGCPDLIDRLQGLSGSDLNSLLLELYRLRAEKLDARAVLKSHARSRFTWPSALDPVRYRELEAELLTLARGHGMTPMLLSPVAPLGSCSAFGCVSQNNVVSATRGLEALADPTNMLALILAERRKRGEWPESAPAHLCATARVTRAQTFAGKNTFAHFGVFCVLSGGRDAGSYACEAALIADQLSCYKEIFAKKCRAGLSVSLRRRAGYKDGDGFFDRMCALFAEKFPNVPIVREEEESDNGYYKGLNFKLYLRAAGEQIEVGDGGFVDWLQQATGDRRERCLISAIGLDRLMAVEPGMPNK